MRRILVATVFAGSLLVLSNGADARGCITGAIVGGIAGHAVHHGIAGAAAGCAAGSGASHYYRTHNSRSSLHRSQQQITPSVAQ